LTKLFNFSHDFRGCVKSHSELVSESQKLKYVAKRDAELHFDELSVKIQHDDFLVFTQPQKSWENENI